MTYHPPQPPPLRQGLASARERQKPVPQASAMIDIPRYYLFLSVAPIVVLFLVAIVLGWLNRERARNERNKLDFLRSLGYEERKEVRTAVREEDKGGLRRRNPSSKTSATSESGSTAAIAPSTSTSTSISSKRPLIIGFWHPYWSVPLFPRFHLCLPSQLTLLEPSGITTIVTPEAEANGYSGLPFTGLCGSRVKSMESVRRGGSSASFIREITRGQVKNRSWSA